MKEGRRIRGETRRDVEKPTRRRAPIIAWLALLLCLGSVGGILAGLLQVRQVRVVGANLPAAAIAEAAGVRGQNIFMVQSDEVIRRLETFREIVVSRVETSFPDRVTIYAYERRAVVAYAYGKIFYELDAYGSPIRQVSRSRLPTILGPDLGGSIGPGVIQAVRDAVKVLATTPKGSIARFQYQPRTGLSIIGSAGWTAIVGDGERQAMRDRVYALATLLTQIRNRPDHLVSVDLRISPFRFAATFRRT